MLPSLGLYYCPLSFPCGLLPCCSSACTLCSHQTSCTTLQALVLAIISHPTLLSQSPYGAPSLCRTGWLGSGSICVSSTRSHTIACLPVCTLNLWPLGMEEVAGDSLRLKTEYDQGQSSLRGLQAGTWRISIFPPFWEVQ